jgi:hypothetical protein
MGLLADFLAIHGILLPLAIRGARPMPIDKISKVLIFNYLFWRAGYRFTTT